MDLIAIHDLLRDGDRTKVRKCVEVLRSSKDNDSFMRVFVLLAM